MLLTMNISLPYQNSMDYDGKVSISLNFLNMNLTDAFKESVQLSFNMAVISDNISTVKHLAKMHIQDHSDLHSH